MSSIKKDLIKYHNRLRDDFKYYAAVAMKIQDKDGKISPFVFNQAQTHIHEFMEQQLRETERVRAIVVKARQLGASTYIQGRNCHALRRGGVSCYTLSHLASTTDMIYDMAKRYNDLVPEPLYIKPDIENSRRLVYNGLRSSYYVGTAGSDKIGVGGTYQRFHGSEVALWENSGEILSGILQAIPDRPNTEVVFESTARGMGNEFYRMAMKALKKTSEYRVVFTPWFWDPMYSKTPPIDFIPNEDELIQQSLYSLTDGQLYWRRLKRASMESDWLFKREYPAHLMEAFQASGATFMDAEKIMEARKSGIIDKDAPIILGVDPAGEGKDRTAISWRRGREFMKYQCYAKMKPMELAGIIAKILVSPVETPAMVFIDVGHGYGTIDRLHELGFKRQVRGVHFGEKATNPQVYRNKRAEIIDSVRLWLNEGGVSMPDDDEIQADFMCIPPAKETSTGLMQLVSKDIIRRDYGSPDILDSFALTFAYVVSKAMAIEINSLTHRARFGISQSSSPLSVVRKRKSRLSTASDTGEQIITINNWLGG